MVNSSFACKITNIFISMQIFCVLFCVHKGFFQIYQVKNFLYGNFSHHLDGGEYAVEGEGDM